MWSRDQCSANRGKIPHFSLGLGLGLELGLGLGLGLGLELGLGLGLGFACNTEAGGLQKWRHVTTRWRVN